MNNSIRRKNNRRLSAFFRLVSQLQDRRIPNDKKYKWLETATEEEVNKFRAAYFARIEEQIDRREKILKAHQVLIREVY